MQEGNEMKPKNTTLIIFIIGWMLSGALWGSIICVIAHFVLEKH